MGWGPRLSIRFRNSREGGVFWNCAWLIPPLTPDPATLGTVGNMELWTKEVEPWSLDMGHPHGKDRVVP